METLEKTENINIVKQVNTEEILIDELEAEIKVLENTKYNLLTYPENSSEEIKQAIDLYNEPEVARQLQDEEILNSKKELLNKCKIL